MVIHNLNSALNLTLEVLKTNLKIRSNDQFKGNAFEKQWSMIAKEYKKRFGQDLQMKTQLFTINNALNNFIKNDVLPSNTEARELCSALSVFISVVVSNMFSTDLAGLDLELLLSAPQVRRAYRAAREAYGAEMYDEVLKKSTLAFHIALEDQRQKLNFLSKKGMLKPEIFMLDKPIELHLEPKDADFIHVMLRTPLKRFERFKQIVPTTLVSEDADAGPEIIISDYVDDSMVSKENAEFCLNFTLETILNWKASI